MTREIALESNISSFWTRPHFNRIIFDETINEMFSTINNSALLRQRLDRDAKSLQITLINLICMAPFHTMHMSLNCVVLILDLIHASISKLFFNISSPFSSF